MENKEKIEGSDRCLINERKKTSIGGQALIEGIMMRGPKRTAMAVRHISGEMIVKAWDNSTKKTPVIFKLPIIRGVYNFISSMSIGYKCLMESAELSGIEEENPKAPSAVEAEADTDTDTEVSAADNGEDKKKKEGESSLFMTVAMGVASVLGIALAILLFMYLPSQIFSWLTIPFPAAETRFTRSLFEGILRIIIFVGYMGLMCLVPDVRRTFMYHGAEHKTIFCYEAGLELTVENVRKMKRFHPRCGTSFMILMLIVGIVISMFISVNNPLLRSAIKIALLPITVGLGYELIKLAGRHDNIFTRIISAPGQWLQRISVLEPDDQMIECAISAVKEVIPDDNSDAW